MKLLLTRDQQATLWHLTETVVTSNGDRYFYFPYILKDCGDGLFERMVFETIPESAKDQILTKKGIKLPAE